jgi:hypothetical protein
MQGVDRLLGWSGKTQRLPPSDADSSVAGRSPQFCPAQLRSQNLAAHAPPANTLDAREWRAILGMKKLRVWRRCFPQCAT